MKMKMVKWLGGVVVAMGLPMTTLAASSTVPVRTLLLHGLFGQGDTIQGGALANSYWPDLASWVQQQTGKYVVFPDLGKGDIDSQVDLALQTMKSSCSNCVWDIVGYSRGGLVARGILGKSPNLVRSVMLVGTPNRGCAICDLSDSHVMMQALLAIYGTDVRAQVKEMSQANMTKFNQRYPLGVPDGVALCLNDRKVPDLSYRSAVVVGGRNIPTAALVGDQDGSASERWSAFSWNLGDASYSGDRVLWPYSASDKKYSTANDGLVSNCSAGFGTTGREGLVLKATDHHDLINQRDGKAIKTGLTAMKNQLQWIWNNFGY